MTSGEIEVARIGGCKTSFMRAVRIYKHFIGLQWCLLQSLMNDDRDKYEYSGFRLRRPPLFLAGPANFNSKMKILNVTKIFFS